MRYSSANKGLPAGNPIANALVVIVGALIIAASVILGFFAFVVLGTAVLIMAAIIGIRLWWLKRKLRNDPAFGQPSPGDDRPHDTIEGEYRVIIEEREDRDA